DYELMAKEIRDEIGVTDEVFTYIPYKSGKEGLTALIGGHADFALCTPAHGSELIASGDVVPQFIYAPEHYQFGDLVDLPTLSEISGGAFKDHEYHVYRVVVASAKMSDEAADFWVDTLKKITESKSFQDYCAKMSLSVFFLPKEEALPLM
ncbi:MAG: hypothetical protein II000_03675, partial [Clostridia bacterium]|nr:hypothetical protein [Clostridia bacterium]